LVRKLRPKIKPDVDRRHVLRLDARVRVQGQLELAALVAEKVNEKI
jgi:hypothetical protein